MASNGLLVQPDGAKTLEADDLYRLLMQLVGRDLGLSDWGSNVNHVSYESATAYAHTQQNQGAGGHLSIPNELTVASDGGGTTANKLGVTTTLGVTGAATLSSTLAVSGAATLSSTLAVTGAATLSSTLAVTGAATLSSTLAVTGATTLTGALTANGSVTLGDASGDTLTVNATATFVNAASFNGDVTLGNASGDALTVNATPTFAAGLTVSSGVLTLPVGSAAAPSLAVGEAGTGLYRQAVGALGLTTGGAERARISSTGLLMAAATPITLPNNTAYRATESDGTTVRSLLSIDASNVTQLGGSTGGLNIDTGGMRLRYAGTKRIEIDNNGIGFFNATPAAKPTVTGSRGGNAALADLLSELATLGLITDSSSA